MSETTKFARIPVSKLFIDTENYQRDPKTVDSIVKKGWDEVQAGALSVSERAGGKYAIMDGGHRFTAALQLGVKSLPCIVLSGATIRREAEVFVGVNRNRKRMAAANYLRGLITAGDPGALEIDATLKRHGLKFADFKGRYTVAAAHALMQAYDRYGIHALSRALAILRFAWGGDAESLSGSFIIGTARVVAAFPKIDDDLLVKKLSRIETTEVARKAKSVAATNRTSEESYATAIVYIYNQRMSATNALDLYHLSQAASAQRGADKRWGTKAGGGPSSHAAMPIAASGR